MHNYVISYTVEGIKDLIPFTAKSDAEAVRVAVDFENSLMTNLQPNLDISVRLSPLCFRKYDFQNHCFDPFIDNSIWSNR